MNGVKKHFAKCASEYLFKSQTKEEIKDYYTKLYDNVSDFNVDDDGNVTFTYTYKMPIFPDNFKLDLSGGFFAKHNKIGNGD